MPCAEFRDASNYGLPALYSSANADRPELSVFWTVSEGEGGGLVQSFSRPFRKKHSTPLSKASKRSPQSSHEQKALPIARAGPHPHATLLKDFHGSSDAA